jgi:C1A family cysteine protease
MIPKSGTFVVGPMMAYVWCMDVRPPCLNGPYKISEPHGMGWVPDRPDNRDFTENSEPIKPLLKAIGVANSGRVSLAPKADLRAWCSPIEDQGPLGSCTANAGVGLVEFFERRAFGRHIDASRLFFYKTTRNLLGWTGDSGAYLRGKRC